MNPLHIGSDIWQHRYLLSQLVKRDVLLRYRGAALGTLWVLLSPLFMLATFAYVFGQIFQSRWPQQGTDLPLWVFLYTGLITFNVFSEAVSRSPISVRSYPSFVKKIVFPVHILPIVPLGASVVHGVVNFFILAAALAWEGTFRAQLFLLPVLMVPVVALALGLSWFLAAWGVFLKDMTQIVPMFLQMLLFLSPVFYPLSAVPEALKTAYHYNPLAITIELSRAAVTGQLIDWVAWLLAFSLGLIVLALGYAFFRHSQAEFVDAL